MSSLNELSDEDLGDETKVAKYVYAEAMQIVGRLKEDLPEGKRSRPKAVREHIKGKIYLNERSIEGEDEAADYFEITNAFDNDHACGAERADEIEAKYGYEYLHDVYIQLKRREIRVQVQQLVKLYFIRWKEKELDQFFWIHDSPTLLAELRTASEFYAPLQYAGLKNNKLIKVSPKGRKRLFTDEELIAFYNSKSKDEQSNASQIAGWFITHLKKNRRKKGAKLPVKKTVQHQITDLRKIGQII